MLPPPGRELLGEALFSPEDRGLAALPPTSLGPAPRWGSDPRIVLPHFPVGGVYRPPISPPLPTPGQTPEKTREMFIQAAENYPCCVDCGEKWSKVEDVRG